MTQRFRFLKLAKQQMEPRVSLFYNLLQGIFIAGYLVILVPEARFELGQIPLQVIRILSRIPH
jgi:hypothetical protein